MNRINIIRNWLFLLLGVGLAACQEEQLTEYQNDPRLSFGAEQDSVVVQSFFVIKSGIDRDTVLLRVETLGFPVDYDRPFSVVQTNVGEENAAVAGKHYLDFDAPEISTKLVIPAGQVETDIPVIALRDKSLQQGIYSLRLEIRENEYFKPGLLDHTSCLVRLSDQADKPDLWDTFWVTYFGKWNSIKMKFIIYYVGLTDFEEVPADYSYSVYLNKKANQQLLDYNAAHPGNPLCTDHNPALEQCDNCITFPKM